MVIDRRVSLSFNLVPNARDVDADSKYGPLVKSPSSRSTVKEEVASSIFQFCEIFMRLSQHPDREGELEIWI
jgi:hypothetical protein